MTGFNDIPVVSKKWYDIYSTTCPLSTHVGDMWSNLYNHENYCAATARMCLLIIMHRSLAEKYGLANLDRSILLLERFSTRRRLPHPIQLPVNVSKFWRTSLSKFDILISYLDFNFDILIILSSKTFFTFF